VHIFTLYFSSCLTQMSNKLEAGMMNGPLGSFMVNSENRNTWSVVPHASVAHSPVNETSMQYTTPPPPGIAPNAVPIVIWMTPQSVSIQ
jgi:hypothetical protein